MASRKKKIAIFAIIIVLVVGYIALRHNKAAVVKIPEVAVTTGTVTEYAEAVGYIKPRHSSTVKSQVSGIVAEIYHYDGEYVAKDTPLLKINPVPSPDIYAEAYQALADAKAREQSAGRDVTRYQQALKSGLIDKNYMDYITAQRDFDTAKAARILAEQKLALIEQGSTTVAGKPIANVVVSPIDGYILNRNVDIGDPVLSLSSAQASTILFNVANMQDLMFEGAVDEMDASKISNGMPATITIGSLPNVSISGTLSKIALQSDNENAASGVNTATTTGTSSPFNVGFKVEITSLQLPKDLILRSGYSATAKIKIKTAENVMILPTRLLKFKESKPYVWIAPASKGEKPKQQFIEMGISDGVNAEIKSGLKLGDKILDKPEAENNGKEED